MPDPDYGGGNYNSNYGTGGTGSTTSGSVGAGASSGGRVGGNAGGNVGGSVSGSSGASSSSSTSSNNSGGNRGGTGNIGGSAGSSASTSGNASSNSDREDRGGSYNSGYGAGAGKPPGSVGGTTKGSVGGSTTGNASAPTGTSKPSGVLGGGGVVPYGSGVPAKPSTATLASTLPSITRAPYSGTGPATPGVTLSNVVSGLDVPPAYLAGERERMWTDPTTISDPTYPNIRAGTQQVAGGKVDRENVKSQDRIVTNAAGNPRVINMAAPMPQAVASALSTYSNPPSYSPGKPPPSNPTDVGAVRDYVTGGVRAPTGTGTQPSGVLGGGGVVAYGGGVPATGSTAAPPSQNVASNGVTGQQQASVSPSQQSGNGGFSFGLGGTPSFGQGGEGAIGPPVLPPASSEPPPATPDPSANPIADAAIQAGVMPWDVSTYLQIQAIYKKAGQAFTPKDFIRAYYKPRVFADPSFELPRANAA